MNKPKNNRKPGAQDIMQTPPHALEPLIPLLGAFTTIWESAAGPERLIQKALERNGFDVIGTDILYDPRYDFLAGYDPSNDTELFRLGVPEVGDWDIQVTNPPYSAELRYKWIKRSFELGKPFALLVPYETTFAAQFKKLAWIYHHNPWSIDKLEPERRIAFKTPQYGWGMKVYDETKDKFIMRGNSAQMPTCWLTWGLDAITYYESSYNTYDIPMRSVQYNNADNSEKINSRAKSQVVSYKQEYGKDT